MSDISLRQYTNIENVRNVGNDQNLQVEAWDIDLAEELIDTYCATYIRPSLRAPFYDTESILTATFNSTNGTFVLNGNESLETNYLKYTNVEVLSGVDGEEGLVLPVKNSTNLTISVGNYAELSNGIKTIRLFQLGKFPRIGDCEVNASNEYYKIIPIKVRQAAAYQTLFILQNPALFDNSASGEFKSESIGTRGQYSYVREDKANLSPNVQLEQMISPQAKKLLLEYRIQQLN